MYVLCDNSTLTEAAFVLISRSGGAARTYVALRGARIAVPAGSSIPSCRECAIPDALRERTSSAGREAILVQRDDVQPFNERLSTLL